MGTTPLLSLSITLWPVAPYVHVVRKMGPATPPKRTPIMFVLDLALSPADFDKTGPEWEQTYEGNVVGPPDSRASDRACV